MLDDHDIISYLNHKGERIAFHGMPGSDPGLFFLSGFGSDMSGNKATFLSALARTQNLGFTRFDYSGHGKSSGDFRKCDIERWFSDSLAVFDEVTTGPQLLVGSSMGGWLALLIAKARPHRVKGVIGVASACDFTEDLIWDKLTETQRKQITRDGFIEAPSGRSERPYVITNQLIESGRRLLLLREPVAIGTPVRLIHGMADREVPWETSVRTAEVLTSTNVRITLIKDAEHRLSRDSDLAVIRMCIEELVAL